MYKVLVFILLLIMPFDLSAQADSSKQEKVQQSFWCDSLLLNQPQLIQVGNQSLKYYLVDSYQVNGSSGSFQGIIIIPDVNVTDDVNFLVSIANAIGTIENLDELLLFKTCAGERAYTSSRKTKYTKRSVRKNFLGRFIINE